MLSRISLTVWSILALSTNFAFGQLMVPKDSRIVFLGDSITQAGIAPSGYVTIVRREVEKAAPGKNIEIIGAGISGNRVPDLQSRLDRDVINKKPTLVFIYIGINDVWHSQSGRGTSKADYESGLLDIIKRVQASGAKVVLCTPSVIGEKSDGTNELDSMLDEYSSISRRVAEKTNSQLLDLRKRFVDHLRSNNPLEREKNVLTRDGVHLNEAGNDFIASQMLSALGIDYQSDTARSVIRHIVMLKFNNDNTEAQTQEIVDAFGKLADEIDLILDYEAGTNVSPEGLNQGLTHAFVVTFRNAKARDAYLVHPVHKEFVKLLDGKIENVLVFDFATKN